MDRLKPDAPRAKVVAYLEQLRVTAEQIAAMPIDTPELLAEAEEQNGKLYKRLFQAFSRAFDGLELRERLNRTHDQTAFLLESDEYRFKACIAERLRIINDAIAIARGAKGKP